jgi:DNA-binding transcriptional regulator YiaG
MWIVSGYTALPMEKIKTTIQTLTALTGLSQADIARLLDVPAKTLNAWLSGRVNCRHKRMLSLALEALDARLTREIEVKRWP